MIIASSTSSRITPFYLPTNLNETVAPHLNLDETRKLESSEKALPLFPQLKKISLADKQIIDGYIHRYAPYSDYYFASLWSWNLRDTIQIAQIFNNLVVKFSDYVTGEPFYSFFGNNQVHQTIEALITKAESEGIFPHLRLIPEHNFHDVDLEKIKIKYHVQEDDNNFDYLLSVEKISSMIGRKLHQKRKLLRHFNQQHTSITEIKSVREKQVQKQILALFFAWIEQANKRGMKNDNELNALLRLFRHAEHFNVKALLLYVDNQLIGFSVFEIINTDFAISSFQKANIAYIGAYEQLNFHMACHLRDCKCTYVNIEQDLGIEGLRRAKKDYDPEYLKKYIISKK